MQRQVRTRYAPSPTGYMHIGNLRTALYEYLIAKSQNGKFILRIEDTDQERLVEGAVDVIYNTLKLCGMQHDEGPDVGGPMLPMSKAREKTPTDPMPRSLLKKVTPIIASVPRRDWIACGLNPRLKIKPSCTIGIASSFPRLRLKRD